MQRRSWPLQAQNAALEVERDAERFQEIQTEQAVCLQAGHALQLIELQRTGDEVVRTDAADT
jgi:hypothetical protein